MNASSNEQYRGYFIDIVTTPVDGGFEARFTVKRIASSALSVTKIAAGTHASREIAETSAFEAARKVVDSLNHLTRPSDPPAAGA